MPPANLDDSSIPPGPILKPGGDCLEQLMDDALILNDGERLSPGMEASVFSQRNHMVCPSPELFGFRIGGLYLLFAQQGSHHIAHHRPAVTRITAELSA